MVIKKKKHHASLMDNPLYARILIAVVLLLLSALCLYPFINVFAKSFSEGHAIYEYPTMITPHSFTLEAYAGFAEVISDHSFRHCGWHGAQSGIHYHMRLLTVPG